MSEDKQSPTASKHDGTDSEPSTDATANADTSRAPSKEVKPSALSPTEKAALRKASPKKANTNAATAEPVSGTAKATTTSGQAGPAVGTTADRNTGADTTKSASHDGGGPPPERRRASSGGRGTFLAIILLLIFLAALGATAWWAHGQWLSFQQDWQVTETSWQEEREQLRGSIGQVETRLSQRENDMADLGSEVDQTRNDLINLATQVNEQAALQDSDIQRLEIEYLLRTARHLSLLTGDLRQAENLLRQADRMLAEFEDLAYLPVREALAQDIQRLREIPMPDVNGLYFELQALAERSLDWQWWPETADLTQQTGEPQAVSDTWYSQVWAEIKDLITVRYRDDANQERLTPSEFNYLQGQFRLLMNQAQVALMQGNQTLYRASLEQAMNWLSTGISQVPQADQVLAQLETLQAQTVAVETPEIDRGLTRLQQMIADAEGSE